MLRNTRWARTLVPPGNSKLTSACGSSFSSSFLFKYANNWKIFVIEKRTQGQRRAHLHLLVLMKLSTQKVGAKNIILFHYVGLEKLTTWEVDSSIIFSAAGGIMERRDSGLIVAETITTLK
jgi:hypothetical protein